MFEKSEMSKRVFLTLPDEVFEKLEDWAGQQGRPVANLAGYLVEISIRTAQEKGDYSPQKNHSQS